MADSKWGGIDTERVENNCLRELGRVTEGERDRLRKALNALLPFARESYANDAGTSGDPFLMQGIRRRALETKQTIDEAEAALQGDSAGGEG